VANIIDKDLGLKRFKRELEKSRSAEVLIGVHAGDKNGEGQLIAEYAAHNEFGTKHIPERSFMRTTFDEQQKKLSAIMARQYSMVQAGTMTVHRALEAIGEKHSDDIKNKINSNIPPVNSPATIKRKKSSKTLVDTGALRNSIHHVVKIV